MIANFFKGIFEVVNIIINTYKNNINLLFETIILLVLCFIISKYYVKFRGFMGEFWLKLRLQKLNPKKYIVLNDIMIKNNDSTSQIDHIVISEYGVFVIEMKNYYGCIYGDEYKDNWYQYVRGKKRKFHNPIYQNYGHVKALANSLNLSEDIFIPIVCFSNQVKLKLKVKSNVVQLDNINNVISAYDKVILKDDINEIAKAILDLNITDKKLRKDHVKTIKTNLKSKTILEQSGRCPKCGSALIRKKGRYGYFIGRTSYPKCKYIKK